MRPFKENPNVRLYPPPPRDDVPWNPPPPLWKELLTAVTIAGIVVGLLLLSGCTVQPSTADRAKRDGVTTLAETAVRPIRRQPVELDEPAYFHAPSLPESVEAWTEPAASPFSETFAPGFEPYQPPIGPQAQNVSPCGPNGCTTSPLRLFRRRRH